MLPQRLKGRQYPKLRAAVALKIAELATVNVFRCQMLLPEMLKQEREDSQLAGCDPRVIDQMGCPQRRELVLEQGVGPEMPDCIAFLELQHRLWIDIDEVQKLPAAGRIGTGAFRLIGEQRVQRVEADDARAPADRKAGQLQEVGEIPDSPIARRSQGEELDGEAPDPSRALQARRKKGTRRRNDQMTLGEGRAVTSRRQPEMMIADRQRRRDEDLPGLPLDITAETASTFRLDIPAQRSLQGPPRNGNDPSLGLRSKNENRWQDRFPRRHMKLLEKAFQSRDRSAPHFAGVVPVGRHDTERSAAFLEGRARHGRDPPALRYQATNQAGTAFSRS